MAGLTALLLLVTALQPKSAKAVLDENCYQFGSAGWDLIYWGDPGVRLPPGGVIPICATGSGGVIFRWQEPQGVFLIPSEQCPDTFTATANETYGKLAPVSDSNEAGFAWIPPSQPGTYWLTSQVAGACEAGVKVRVDVIGPPSSAGAGWQQQVVRLVLLASGLLGVVLILAG